MLVGLLVTMVLLAPGAAIAQAPDAAASGATAQPVASAPPIIGSGDPRSDGEGPGIVGSPVAIAVGVVVLGVLTALGTVLVLRIGGPRRGR
jgi:hypothetical protein